MPKKTKEKAEIIEKKEVKTNVNKKEHASTKQTKPKKEEKQTISKKTPSKKKVQKRTTTKQKEIKKIAAKKKVETKKADILEYYDLPYRYNQTMVKVLAQTPTTLFVYWDIADEDRESYKKQYGEYFFHHTKPVLVVYNKTKNYYFEVEINDFANSWYFPIHDSDCDYQIELGRRPMNEHVILPNNYLSITTSNSIEAPNDHILFDKLSHFVYVKNVKTNQITQKNIANVSLLTKIAKINSIQEFYQKLYPEESIHLNQLDLRNPSSGNPTSSFK